MADLKHLKVQPHGKDGDSDPLAELTRIMGLNPQTGARETVSDEFGIDLERELIGDMGANDSRAPGTRTSNGVSAPAVTAPAGSPAQRSNDGWKPASVDVPSASRGQAAMDGPRPAIDPFAALSKPVAPSVPQGLTSRAAPQEAEKPATRRDWSIAGASAQTAPSGSTPVARAPSDEAAEEDPFERLAAFSRQWLDRSQPDAGAAATGPGFRMPSQPSGPVSAVPAPERAKPVSDVSPRPVPSTAIPSASPASPASGLSSTVPASMKSTASRLADPAPVVPPPAEDKIFDPFAELVAMAGQTRQTAPAGPEGPAAIASVPAAAPASPQPRPQAVKTDPAPADGAAPYQSTVANPSIIARRTNWQSATGNVPAFTPRDPSAVTPQVAAAAAATIAPSVARAAMPAQVEPAAVETAPAKPEPEAYVPQVQAPDHPASDERPTTEPASPALQNAPATPVVEAEAPEASTWDAISAWVTKPSERRVQPSQDGHQANTDDLDDFFRAEDEDDASVLPPVAQIPGLAPETAGEDDLGGFDDDFDLESLLMSELEGEGYRAEDGGADRKATDLAAALAPSSQPERAFQGASARNDGVERVAEARDAQAQAVSKDVLAELEEPEARDDDDGMPDVDTVEVPTAPYVVADEIDIPELHVEDDVQPAIAADDIDADFGGGFEDRPETRPAAGMAAGAAVAMGETWSNAAPRVAPGTARHDDVDELDAAFDEAVRSWAEAENRKEQGAEGTAATGGAAMWMNVRPGLDSRAHDDDDFDPTYQPGPAASYEGRSVQKSRGLMVAAVVAGIAVIGGVGAFVMSMGGGEGGDAPVLVRADQEPVKVKPDQPGGMTVPNQDKAVYERFSAGGSDGQPAQERLVSNQEEPVSLAVRTVPITAPTALIDPADAETADELPGAFGQSGDLARPKSEDRVEATDDFDPALSEEIAVIAPHRVRTMVVRPDGTLVPREEMEPQAVMAAAEPAPAPLAQAPIRTSDAAPAASAASDMQPASSANGTAPAAASENPAAPVADAVQDPPVRTVETRTITRDQATPSRGPVAPTRPSDQPVDIVGNAGAAPAGTQVAAATPAPVVAAQSSEWAMQIASQPTPEGAQASYADLSRRYSSVLNGRGVNIVRAEIAGKGTYWRVRIPAGSRAEANTLCDRYKAAGGSCFVSR
ncbi:SPOR domain-containing protein [Aquibium carbonis]|uniref:SPOR domain-containing protein n=1 Tax=Aquibium carbonis TaxID=2495581 RepID=A0A429YYG8_9HYPH|nr:SPOR domain-containing protein [Aquibium carbonis]RST86492.1 SPOR domain-containing protein [Aquibium carbonis]